MVTIFGDNSCAGFVTFSFTLNRKIQFGHVNRGKWMMTIKTEFKPVLKSCSLLLAPIVRDTDDQVELALLIIHPRRPEEEYFWWRIVIVIFGEQRIVWVSDEQGGSNLHGGCHWKVEDEGRVLSAFVCMKWGYLHISPAQCSLAVSPFFSVFHFNCSSLPSTADIYHISEPDPYP